MEAKPIPDTAKNMLLMRIDRVVFIAIDLRCLHSVGKRDSTPA
jgi:hypothetical protein